ncbi:MAG TPA: hypothetical protein PKB10_03475 [Tepidisphaeraceae bacterium]|nr:hypothetical protein [Tepidisphaeraceae bacterium]
MTLLTISVLIGLAPLAAPKPVLDYVLGDRPLPPTVQRYLPALSDGPTLLAAIGIGLIVLAVVSTAVSIISRWTMTRVSKRIQMNTRRVVFEHAVRLPLHRVYEIKSGGAASLLREDAGGWGSTCSTTRGARWCSCLRVSRCCCGWIGGCCSAGCCCCRRSGSRIAPGSRASARSGATSATAGR